MTHSTSDSIKSNIAQDLDIQITSLLGECPLSENGKWVTYIESDQFPEGAIVFPVLTISGAKQLASELAEKTEELESCQVTTSAYEPSDAANSLPPEVAVYKYHLKAD